MSKLLYLSIAWPFIVFGAVMNFIVWEFFSDGGWKESRVQADPARYWQGRALAASREIHDLEDEIKRREKEQERKK